MLVYQRVIPRILASIIPDNIINPWFWTLPHCHTAQMISKSRKMDTLQTRCATHAASSGIQKCDDLQFINIFGSWGSWESWYKYVENQPLVGGFNMFQPPEKYESQIGSSSQLLGKIKNGAKPPSSNQHWHGLVWKMQSPLPHSARQMGGPGVPGLALPENLPEATSKPRGKKAVSWGFGGFGKCCLGFLRKGWSWRVFHWIFLATGDLCE